MLLRGAIHLRHAWIAGTLCLVVGCGIPPTGKAYDERKAAQFALGMSTTAEVVKSMGTPWHAHPLLANELPKGCVGPSEQWIYSYFDRRPTNCTTRLSFDGNAKLCDRNSAVVSPGPGCLGVAP